MESGRYDKPRFCRNSDPYRRTVSATELPLTRSSIGATEVARVQAGPRTIARVRLLPAKALSGGANAFIPSLLEKGLNDPAFFKECGTR